MSLHKYTFASLWYGVCVFKSYEYMSLHKNICASKYENNMNTCHYTDIYVRLCGMVCVYTKNIYTCLYTNIRVLRCGMVCVYASHMNTCLCTNMYVRLCIQLMWTHFSTQIYMCVYVVWCECMQIIYTHVSTHIYMCIYVGIVNAPSSSQFMCHICYMTCFQSVPMHVWCVCVRMCVYVCVCVCEREREEREWLCVFHIYRNGFGHGDRVLCCSMCYSAVNDYWVMWCSVCCSVCCSGWVSSHVYRYGCGQGDPSKSQFMCHVSRDSLLRCAYECPVCVRACVRVCVCVCVCVLCVYRYGCGKGNRVCEMRPER